MLEPLSDGPGPGPGHAAALDQIVHCRVRWRLWRAGDLQSRAGPSLLLSLQTWSNRPCTCRPCLGPADALPLRLMKPIDAPRQHRIISILLSGQPRQLPHAGLERSLAGSEVALVRCPTGHHPGSPRLHGARRGPHPGLPYAGGAARDGPLYVSGTTGDAVVQCNLAQGIILSGETIGSTCYSRPHGAAYISHNEPAAVALHATQKAHNCDARVFRQSKDKREISGLPKVLPSLTLIRSPRDVQGLRETLSITQPYFPLDSRMWLPRYCSVSALTAPRAPDG